MTTADQRAAERKRYRVPTVTPECEPVRLSDFSFDEIREYLRQNNKEAVDDNDENDHQIILSHTIGSQLCESGHIIIDPGSVSHIATLALCGQKSFALAELARIVSDCIGRPL